MCDFVAIISTILSQMWTIYIHTRTNCYTQWHWPNMGDRRSFRFLSHLLLFDWIQIFNGFHKFPISRCVCLYVLECVSYVMRMQTKRDDIAYAIRRWWENKEWKKTVALHTQCDRDRIEDSVNHLFTFFPCWACDQLKTRSTWKSQSNKLY